MIEHKPVQSSNVATVGFDADKSELHIRFKSGGHYVYEAVPAELHSNMLIADSIGKFIGLHIKGKFTHRKIT